MSSFSTFLLERINNFFTTIGLKGGKKEHISALLPLKSGSSTNFSKQNKKEVIENFNNLLSKTYLEKNEYIKFVTKYYKDLGYTVWEYSKEKELPDSEIHLVIKKENNILLIQCHNDHENLSTKNIADFEVQSISFVKENRIFESYNIQLIYIMSTLLLEESAYKYIKKSKNIHYRILKEQIE